ncbi:PepSY-associated TM helix domain-containing protein [Undibacterium sp. RuRC25W]|uniref:PepSY-associated TM helix domain-containing protein n=1 Tax=Undibacterium sp. RuRC25W TaxID=3413047 RepID=UPI003BEF8A03
MTSPVPTSLAITYPHQQRRAFWLRQLHQWHWISSALCLTAMLLFAFSGITLNHASQIEAHPHVTKKTGHLPDSLLHLLKEAQATTQIQTDQSKALPESIRSWLTSQLAIRVDQQIPEWSPEEVYVALPRPGGDAWLRMSLDDGTLEYELTDGGWIAYINDLHKGRNTGTAWNYLIDGFAVLCLTFCVTGFFLLKMHAANRPSTWPLVLFGVVLPLLLALTFVH